MIALESAGKGSCQRTIWEDGHGPALFVPSMALAQVQLLKAGHSRQDTWRQVNQATACKAQAL